MTAPQLPVRSDASTRAAANEALAVSVPTCLDDGAALLHTHGIAALRAAFDRAGAAGEPDNGWALFWRGYVAQFDDLYRARSDWLHAAQLFARDDDGAGLELAACGLAQATVLDNQADSGFDERAPFVERMQLAPRPSNALDLFRLAGRMSLSAERRDAGDAGAHLTWRRAFASLALEVETEVRLRTAVAALPLLGLALSPTQADDFSCRRRAGAITSGVGLRPRPMAHARGRCAVLRLQPRRSGEGGARGARPWRAPRRAARAAGARAGHDRRVAAQPGQAAQAKQHLDAAHPMLDPAQPRDYWMFHYYSSRHALLIGAAEDAWEHAKMPPEAGGARAAARTTPS